MIIFVMKFLRLGLKFSHIFIKLVMKLQTIYRKHSIFLLLIVLVVKGMNQITDLTLGHKLSIVFQQRQ